MTPRSLRDAADEADAARFLGRGPEMETVAEVLDPGTPSRILFVHGPGGIGKSTLLRAAGRLAAQEGYRVTRIDARTLPAELEPAVEAMREGGDERRSILLDEVDVLGPRLEALRDRLLSRLADSTGCSWRAGAVLPRPGARAASTRS